MGKNVLIGIVFTSENQKYFHLTQLGQVGSFLQKRIDNGDVIKEVAPLEEEGSFRAFLRRAAESLHGGPQMVAG